MFHILALALGASDFLLLMIVHRHGERELVSAFLAFIVVGGHTHPFLVDGF